MNCEAFRDQLADFVGGELDPDRHAAAAEHLEQCDACRELARGLQGAAAALEANVVSPETAAKRTADLTIRMPESESAVRPTPGYARVTRILRYAAVVMLAFGAGYVLRGWQAAPVFPPPAENLEIVGESINPALAKRIERVSRQYPEASTLTQGLICLAAK